VDSLVFFLNTKFATILLLVVGIVCIYLELQMTTGILGIISALCFALFFWSRFLGGTAGWLEVILFLLGVGCILMEIFVIPGFGVFGISGGLMLLASLILASQTFGNLEPSRDFELLSQTMGNLAISVMLVVFIAMTLSRYLPHVPIFNRMVLTPPAFEGAAADAGPRLRPEHLDGTMALIGEQGSAISVLRPAGKAEIDGKFLDVVSDGPFISAGMPIEVVQVTGNRIVVRAMKSQEKE
jgi:membrane-bound serine protease (ClpP class)